MHDHAARPVERRWMRESLLRENHPYPRQPPVALQIVQHLQPGDVVITPAVNRLSRDTTDLLVIARQMRKIGGYLRSAAEPLLDTTLDFAGIVPATLGVVANLERRRILERTANGRPTAKALGARFGRKPILTLRQQREAAACVAAGELRWTVARSYNVSRSTISRLPTVPAVPHA